MISAVGAVGFLELAVLNPRWFAGADRHVEPPDIRASSSCVV